MTPKNKIGGGYLNADSVVCVGLSNAELEISFDEHKANKIAKTTQSQDRHWMRPCRL
jgi:hypothetical protein